jgi:hypothetical protein
MALNAALKQLIETKLAHTRAPQWDGARFPANARHRSGRTDGNRGNRTSLELMERSHAEHDGQMRSTVAHNDVSAYAANGSTMTIGEARLDTGQQARETGRCS